MNSALQNWGAANNQWQSILDAAKQMPDAQSAAVLNHNSGLQTNMLRAQAEVERLKNLYGSQYMLKNR
jgi:hypothetical protein